MRLVQVARGLGVGEDVAEVERAPVAVRATDGVGDEDVRMQVRVARPARAMAKRSAEQAVTHDFVDAVAPAAGPGRLALEGAERGVDAFLVCITDDPGNVRLAEPQEDGHGLGRREREVETRGPSIR